MNINFNYTDDGKGALWLAGKSITPQDIIEANERFIEEGQFKSLKYLIISLLDCTNFSISSDNIPRIAELDIEDSNINDNLYLIILAGDPIVYSSAKLWEGMLRETNWRTAVHKTKREGIEWLQSQIKSDIPSQLFNIKFRAEPIQISYDSEKNLLVHKGVGNIKFGDFLTLYRRLSNYDIKPNYKVIADYSDAYTELSFEELLIMAQKRSDTAKDMGTISIALVGRSELIQHLLRIYKVLLNKELFKVEQFDNRLAAEAWLKV